LLLGSGLLCGGVVALAGGVALGGAGLVAAGVAGAVSAALAAGVARESPTGSRATAADAAWKAAACTAGGLLLVSGVVVLAGGTVATLLTGLTAAAGLGVWLLRRQRRGAAAASPSGRPVPSAGSPGRPSPVSPLAGAAGRQLPVSALPTHVLGREWLRSTAALAGRLEPAARQRVVRRREETLDELERRDPAGFARWLAAGPGADPAQFVHGDARGDVRGDTAAGTDAA
jgi:hypothetical protein